MAGSVQSVERAAAMLRLLAVEDEPLGLAQVAAGLGLAKGTAHGLLRTLVDVGFVDQDAGSGRYRVGVDLLHLGSTTLDMNELRSLSLNWVDTLAARAGEAARIAARTAPPGPTPEPEQLRAAVASIRGHAEASVDHVHAISGLAAARGLDDAPVVVVDRAGWSRANTATFELLLEPALSELRRARADRLDRGMNAELIQSVAARAAAAEAGGLMAYLSTKVLGQYDPYAGMVSEDAARRFPGGRLMVVAPNVLQIERELNVDPDDFRLWVCLHEQTHRVQFAAAPWLREQMIRDMRELTVSLSGSAVNAASVASPTVEDAR